MGVAQIAHAAQVTLWPLIAFSKLLTDRLKSKALCVFTICIRILYPCYRMCFGVKPFVIGME